MQAAQLVQTAGDDGSVAASRNDLLRRRSAALFSLRSGAMAAQSPSDLLLALDRRASQARMQLIEIAPQGSSATKDRRLEGAGFDVRLAGSFGNIVELLHLLSAERLPLRVDRIAIRRAQNKSSQVLESNLRLTSVHVAFGVGS